MLLKQYLAEMSIDQREPFAKRCGTSLRHLQNIAYGYKPAGESLCINIERESEGVVPCETLRPDVDWAVLRNSRIEASPTSGKRHISDRRPNRRKKIQKP